ncbi:MAG: ATP-binding protein [Arenimonas sp.]
MKNPFATNTASQLHPLREKFILIALRAVMLACAVFAVLRGWVEWSTGLLTPWFVNLIGLLLVYALYWWFRRNPQPRLAFTAHTLAVIASVALIIPMAYGMVSSVWWLALVAFAMWLMAERREAIAWSIKIALLMPISQYLAPHFQVTGAAGETAIEAAFATLMFVTVLAGIAFSFRYETDLYAARLADSNESLSKANAAKERFLAHMSHELRTPLHGIMGMNDGALRGALEPEQRRRIEVSQSSAELLLRLLDDVLDVSRANADALQLELRPFSLADDLYEALLPLALRAGDKGIALHASAGKGIADLRIGDSLRIRQIVLNLLGNAIKFTEAGHIDIEIKQWEEYADGIVIEVTDTGIGIAPEHLERVLQPFERVAYGLTRPADGAGLGLSIVNELAMRMQGSVEVQSEPGHGSCFTARIRLAMQADNNRDMPGNILEQTSKAVPENLESIATKKSLLVLVSEDNDVNRLVIEQSLEMLGHKVLLTSNGGQAMQVFMQQAPDLVLTDIEMPVLDGYGVLAQVRQSCIERGLPPIPVFAVTAHAQRKDAERFLAAGFDGYLTKPFNLNDLQQVLEPLTR